MAFVVSVVVNARLAQGATTRIRDELRSALTGLNLHADVQVSPAALTRLSALTRNVEALTREFTTLTGASNATATSLEKSSSAYSRLAAAAQAAGSSVARTSATATSSAAGFTAGANAAREYGLSVGAAARRSAAFIATFSAFHTVTGAFRASLAEAIRFDTQLVSLRQVSDDGARSVQSLRSTILGLSKDLGVSSSELTEAAVAFSQAGFSAEKNKSAVEAFAKTLLSASFGPPKQTIETIIASEAQFAKSTEDLAARLGALNSISAQFAVEAGDLSVAVSKAGGSAASAGASFNELLALFTSVRARTRESSDSIATGLRTVFSFIQRQDSVELLRNFGVELRRTRAEAEALAKAGLGEGLEGQFVGPMESLTRLSRGLANLKPTDPRYSQVVEELGGVRQVSRMIPLLQNLSTAENALNVARLGSASLDSAAAIRQDAIANKLEKVKQAYGELTKDLVASPGFRAFVETIKQATDALSYFLKGLGPIAPSIAAFGLGRLAGPSGSFVGGVAQGLFRVQAPRKFARGGVVPGEGSGDTVPAFLEPGEFVVRKHSAQRLGYDTLHALNTGREHLAGGGPAGKSVVTAANIRAIVREYEAKTGIKFGSLAKVRITNNDYFGDRLGTGEATFGTFNRRERVIRLNRSSITSMAALRETIAHEFGHVVDLKLGGGREYLSDRSESRTAKYGRREAALQRKYDMAAGVGLTRQERDYSYSRKEGFARAFAAHLTGDADETVASRWNRRGFTSLLDDVARRTNANYRPSLWQQARVGVSRFLSHFAAGGVVGPQRFADGGAVFRIVLEELARRKYGAAFNPPAAARINFPNPRELPPALMHIPIPVLAGLLGARAMDEAAILANPYGLSGTVTGRGYRALRTIGRDASWVENSVFFVNPKLQGSGIGTALYARQLASALSLPDFGIAPPKFRFNAARASKKFDGYYVWPAKFGADGPLEKTFTGSALARKLDRATGRGIVTKDEADAIAAAVGSTPTIASLLDAPGGPAFWKARGKSIDVVIDPLSGRVQQALAERLLKGMATGGHVPLGAGAPGKDSVHAMLTPGEFVLRKQAVDRLGLTRLEHMNRTGRVERFADGGPVGFAGGGGVPRLTREEIDRLVARVNSFDELKDLVGRIPDPSAASTPKERGRVQRQARDVLQEVARRQAIDAQNVQAALGIHPDKLAAILAGPPAPPPPGSYSQGIAGVRFGTFAREQAERRLAARGGDLDQLAPGVAKSFRADVLAGEQNRLASAINRQLQAVLKNTSSAERLGIAQTLAERAIRRNEEVLLDTRTGALLGLPALGEQAKQNDPRTFLRRFVGGPLDEAGRDRLGRTRDFLAAGPGVPNDPTDPLRPGLLSRTLGRALRVTTGDGTRQVTPLGLAYASSFALPAVTQQFAASQDQVNTAAATHSTGAVARANAIAAGGAGGSIGLAFAAGLGVTGPVGLGIAAVVGAGSFIAQSLRDTARQVTEARLGQAVERLGTQFTILARSGRGLVGADAGIVDDIRTARGTALLKAADETQGALGGLFSRDPAALRAASVRETRAAFIGQAPLYSNVLTDEAVALGRRNPNANPRELVAQLNHPGGLGAELLRALGDVRQVPVDRLLTEFTQSIRNSQESVRVEREFDRAAGAASRVSVAFERVEEFTRGAFLSTGPARARGETLGLGFNAASGLGVPNFGDALARLGVRHTADQEPAFDVIRQSLGSQAEPYIARARAANEAALAGPQVLRELLETPYGAGAPPEQKVRESATRLLYPQLRGVSDEEERRKVVAADPAKAEALEFLIGVINSSVSRHKEDPYKEFRFDQTSFIDNAFRGSGYGSGLLRSGPGFLGQISEFGNFVTGQLRVGRERGDVVAEQRGRTADAGLLRDRYAADALAGGDGARLLTLDQLLRPGESRQTDLLRGTGLRNDDAAGIAARLADRQQEAVRLAEERNRHQGDSERFPALAREFDAVSAEAARLQQALKNLADPTQKLAALQERLQSLQGDREGRLSFAERYLTADPQSRLTLARGQLLAAQVNQNQARFGRLSDADRRLAIEGLRNVGSAQFDNGKTGNQVLEEVLASLPGLLHPGRRAERDDVLRQRAAVAGQAVNAGELLSTALENENRRFLDNLTRIQEEFFARLAVGNAGEQLRGAETRRNTAAADVGDLARLRQQRDLLGAVGVRSQADLERARVLAESGDIDRFRQAASLRVPITENGVLVPREAQEVRDKTREAVAAATTFEEYDRQRNDLTGRGNARAAFIQDVLGRNPLFTALPDEQKTLASHAIGERFEDQYRRRVDQLYRLNGIDTGVRNRFGIGTKPDTEEYLGARAGEAAGLRRRAAEETLSDFTVYELSTRAGDVAAERNRRMAEAAKPFAGLAVNPALLVPEGSRNKNEPGIADADVPRLLDVFRHWFRQGSGRSLDTLDDQYRTTTQRLADLDKEVERLTNRFRELAPSAERPTDRRAAVGAALGPAAVVGGFADGGPVFRPKGTDTVPAMLTPGEHVINRASAVANRELLHRINKARGPLRKDQYLADGGIVDSAVGAFVWANQKTNRAWGWLGDRLGFADGGEVPDELEVLRRQVQNQRAHHDSYDRAVREGKVKQSPPEAALNQQYNRERLLHSEARLLELERRAAAAATPVAPASRQVFPDAPPAPRPIRLFGAELEENQLGQLGFHRGRDGVPPRPEVPEPPPPPPAQAAPAVRPNTLFNARRDALTPPPVDPRSLVPAAPSGRVPGLGFLAVPAASGAVPPVTQPVVGLAPPARRGLTAADALVLSDPHGSVALARFQQEAERRAASLPAAEREQSVARQLRGIDRRRTIESLVLRQAFLGAASLPGEDAQFGGAAERLGVQEEKNARRFQEAFGGRLRAADEARALRAREERERRAAERALQQRKAAQTRGSTGRRRSSPRTAPSRPPT